MPGNKSFNVANISSMPTNNREIIDHLFMLREQLEYTLSNLDSTNFNYKFFDELTVRVQNGLNIEGIVTFGALAERSQTIINGAYIKTGTVEASNFKTYTCSENTITYGEVLMYYQEYADNSPEDALLAGGLRMDDEGLGTDESSRYRLWLYTENIPDSGFKVSLKLSSAYRASLEAYDLIYISCKDLNESNVGSVIIEGTNITLRGVVKIDGKLKVNGSEITG